MSENGQWTRICRRRGNKALANGVGYAEDCSGAKLELNPVSGRRDAGLAHSSIVFMRKHDASSSRHRTQRMTL